MTPGQRQRGLTMAELLVAVALGMLVTLLALSLLVTSNAGYIAQSEAASVDDAGRYAIAILDRSVRQAGYINVGGAHPGGVDPAGPPAVYGLDATTLPSATPALGNSRPSPVNGSDLLALRFAGSGAGNGDGSAITCAGFAVGAGQQGWSIFYVGVSAAGESELRCKYQGANHWSADAVIGGVDSFQVLYGIDTDRVADGIANQFLNARQVHALDDTLTLSGASDAERLRDRMRRSAWKRVASIRVALVVHGARPSVSADGPEVWNLFGEAYSTASGGRDEGVQLVKSNIAPALQKRERRLFSTTILLRNRAL